MEFVTSIQKASEWGVTKRMVNYWCALGKVDGAVKDGIRWKIPMDAERPDRYGESSVLIDYIVRIEGKNVSVGNQSFESIRENDSFYVDKTSFIEQWWESSYAVTLITRPRRFGKTLNLSMMECFFSNKYADRADLFEGLSIWQDEEYRKLQGTYPVIFLSFATVKAGNLKDTYQVVLSVENPGEESPSTDSFPLYVYDADALKVQNDKGETISKLTMDNTSKVSGTLPTDTAKILQLRQELGLIEYIGINYDKYRWNSFKDGIRWLSSNNNAISVNYKQGGLYGDIRNFSFDSYLPETKMALSGLANGTATVTATHAATGMSAAVQVTAKTLQDKFYLFQLTPAAETTLQYTDGKGVPKTVTTNSDGVLALYEPNGIASEVSLRSGSGADIYLGTIYKENLRSGERDATKLQLYPLNTFSLRRVARASVTLITPGGDPLANKTVTVRGGVYKNGGYCQTALLGSRAGALVSGITGDTYTTDAAGNITVYLDSTQFWSAEKGESNTTALSALDQLEYILEISAIDGQVLSTAADRQR